MTEDIEVRIATIEQRIERGFAVYQDSTGMHAGDADDDVEWLIQQLRSARKDAERYAKIRPRLFLDGTMAIDPDTSNLVDAWLSLAYSPVACEITSVDIAVDSLPSSTQEEQ